MESAFAVERTLNPDPLSFFGDPKRGTGTGARNPPETDRALHIWVEEATCLDS